MSSIDIETFKKVLEQFEPEDLEPDTLEVVIRSISRWYATNKQRGQKMSRTKFHERYGLTLLHYGIDELFSAKIYRTALGGYFSQRSVLKRLKKSLKEDPVAPINKVGMMMGVSRDRASVQTTPMVVIKFKATKPTGHLEWNDVVVVERLFYGSKKEEITSSLYRRAHQQALAAMNQRRVYD